ncbi:MAG: glycosyltransferase [Patescibacteria group bacterium]|nr:glycosyltransferase [Patescibacteria group bacterium]
MMNEVKSLDTEIKGLTDALRGQRILHLSATANGGGVAEILRSEVPMLQDLGIKADWQVIEPPAGFFEVTKKIHNALQGEHTGLSPTEWRYYEAVSKDMAKKVAPAQWDAIIVHDPQPAAIPYFRVDASDTKWIWRCHLDSSDPHGGVANRMAKYLLPYAGGIFSLESFRLPGFSPEHLAIIPPAIDADSKKNRPMDKDEAQEILRAYPLDLSRPFVVQVSRFDQWKDPLGVLEAWRLAKQKVSELQLALVGDTADDDPQAPMIVKELRGAAKGDDGLLILVDEADDRTVKAFQTLAVAAVQKSLREGFGLSVTEALWAGTPVIASNVGGIPLQIEEGRNGYLVSTIPKAADRMAELAADPAKAKRMGTAGRKIVEEKFLMPRLVRDDLTLVAKVLGAD